MPLSMHTSTVQRRSQAVQPSLWRYVDHSSGHAGTLRLEYSNRLPPVLMPSAPLSSLRVSTFFLIMNSEV